jgi:hypothetical protein
MIRVLIIKNLILRRKERSRLFKRLLLFRKLTKEFLKKQLMKLNRDIMKFLMLF